MLERQFDRLGLFIEKRYKVIIVIWIVAFLLMIPFASKAIGITSYNVELTSGNATSMSQKAQNLYNNQFNSSNSSNDSIIVLFVNSSFYSSNSYQIWSQFNSSYRQGLKNSGINGLTSPYPVANNILDSVGGGVYKLYVNVRNASQGIISGYVLTLNGTREMINFTLNLYRIDEAIISAHRQISGAVYNFSYLLNITDSEIVNIANMIYGIPIGYFQAYEGTFYQYQNLSNSTRDQLAQSILLNETHYFGGNESSLGYFSYFYNAWNNTSGSIQPRLNNSIKTAVYQFSSMLNSTEQQLFLSVYSSYDVAIYSNNTSRAAVTASLLRNISYQEFGRFSPEIFNLTYATYEEEGNYGSLGWNLTVMTINQSSPAISSFVSEFYGESLGQFSTYLFNASNPGRVIFTQLNASSLNGAMVKLSTSLDISLTSFYSHLVANDSSFVYDSYVNAVSPQVAPLSNLTTVPESIMIESMLTNGTNSTSYYLTEKFIDSQFSGSPYFYFSNVENFISLSNITKGNVSQVGAGNYNETGMKFNSTLFQVLVPRNFDGYIMLLTFNSSSLDSTQLNIVNQYLSNEQKNFPSVQIYYTGSDEIANGVEATSVSSLVESMIVGIIVSIIIVGLFFRSPIMAFVPLALFGISYSITLGIVYLVFGVIEKTTLSFIVTTISAILVLGLSVDYSVYMLNRYFRSKATDRIENTVKWAGHAVFTSGLTVVISYIVLAVSDIPLIGVGGYVNAIGITASLGVALTLLPSFLKMFQKRINHSKSRLDFNKVAGVSRKHRNFMVIVLVLVFVVSLIVYEVTPTSFDLFSMIPSSPGKTGYYEIAARYSYDVLSPNFILINFTSPLVVGEHFNQSELNTLNHISSTILNQSYIGSISTVTYPFGNPVQLNSLSGSNSSISLILNQSKSFIGKNGMTVLIQVYTKDVAFSQGAINSMNNLDSLIANTVPHGTSYLIGGSSQGLLDSSNYISLSTLRIVEILSIIIFLVLSYQLSSLFTPLRLLFNVGTSALAAVVVFYGVFYYLLHLPIVVFGPLFVIVTLFGVGLDYDIFLVTRTREEVMRGKSDEDAVTEALKENAGVIIALGLILSGVFGALIISPIAMIKEIGFSLTVGVLIDTMISWLFFIPALMLVMKKYNWWPSKIGIKRP
ncbi:MAG: MMPL family transporter [Candidatus Thermoplasmatota archaeon]|nr:MMPL family transporter [Candidatus Thermoplasmatota archaeon]